MIAPPRWTPEQLDQGRQQAIIAFRAERLGEPQAAYSDALENYQDIINRLLRETGDLRSRDDDALRTILTDAARLDAFRYLAGPPVSTGDLKTLAQANSLAPSRLVDDSELIRRIGQIVLDCLDRHRFPWVVEKRPPSGSERDAAILASAALMAYQRIQTARRSEGKKAEEAAVHAALIRAGFSEVPRRRIVVLGNAPQEGEFCAESTLGTRKADFVVGLWDQRKLPIECKVSNSELNSVKRLNNDAAAKAESWLQDFGPRNVVPIAILAGVYKLGNLVEAQERGLTLFWAHDLSGFMNWCSSCRGERG